MNGGWSERKSIGVDGWSGVRVGADGMLGTGIDARMR